MEEPDKKSVSINVPTQSIILKAYSPFIIYAMVCIWTLLVNQMPPKYPTNEEC